MLATIIVLFLGISTALFWLYVFYRIMKPFDCSCGFRSHFVRRFKKHVLQSHRWH